VADVIITAEALLYKNAGIAYTGQLVPVEQATRYVPTLRCLELDLRHA
jgi:hypothetical protein